MLQKKVVSSAGSLNILGFIQFPKSELLITEQEIILNGYIVQRVKFSDITKIERKRFIDFRHFPINSTLLGKGIRIWGKGDLFQKLGNMVIISDPDPIIEIIKQKRPDLDVN